MNEDTNPVFDFDEHNAKLVKSLAAELEDKHVEQTALRDRAELWQRAAQDALDQVSALKVRCELAERGREEWRKTADEWMRASHQARMTPSASEVALHQFAIYHLQPRRPVRLIQPHAITYPHRYEIPAGVVGYLNHDHGTEPIEDGGVVVEIPVAHVPGLKLDGIRSVYPRVALGALALHEDWTTNPESPAAARHLPEDVARELEAIRGAHQLDTMADVLRVLLGRYKDAEDSARMDGETCETCGRYVCDGCVPNKPSRVAVLTVTETLPAKVQEISIDLTLTADGVSVDGHPPTADLKETAERVAKETGDHLDALAGSMGY